MQATLHPQRKWPKLLPSMALKWTRTALRNLDEIAAYIALDKPAEATRFARELRTVTERLQSFPGLGRAGRVPGTRELVLHTNYLTIYRVVKAGDVEILRIHHVARLL